MFIYFKLAVQLTTYCTLYADYCQLQTENCIINRTLILFNKVSMCIRIILRSQQLGDNCQRQNIEISLKTKRYSLPSTSYKLHLTASRQLPTFLLEFASRIQLKPQKLLTTPCSQQSYKCPANFFTSNRSDIDATPFPNQIHEYNSSTIFHLKNILNSVAQH